MCVHSEGTCHDVDKNAAAAAAAVKNKTGKGGQNLPNGVIN